jgi:hypothetical protein
LKDSRNLRLIEEIIYKERTKTAKEKKNLPKKLKQHKTEENKCKNSSTFAAKKFHLISIVPIPLSTW